MGFNRTWDKMICPRCEKEFEIDWSPGEPLPPGFPFCSERCKMIDLGKILQAGGVEFPEDEEEE